MGERRIILSHEDFTVLSGLIRNLRKSGKLKQPHFARLAREVADATVLESDEIPHNVVSIHSRVTYVPLPEDSERESEEVSGSRIAEIVFPAEVASGQHRISILSPLGLGLIGERKGTDVEYAAPGGTYRIHIEDVEHMHNATAVVSG